MNLKNLIGKFAIRNKPREIFEHIEGCWDFSFLDRPVKIIAVTNKYIIYEYFCVNKKTTSTELLPIRADDGGWEEYKFENQRKYYLNHWMWEELYLEAFPEQLNQDGVFS